MSEAAALPAAEPATPVEAAEAHAVCANCGKALLGDYCHGCGQKAHLQSKLRHLLREFFESVASFDGRLFRTVPLLAFRPGQLSRRWRQGQRVRYVAPLHFFLFAMFLLFLVPELTGRHLINVPKDMQVSAAPGPGLNASLDVGRARDEARAESLARLREADQRTRAAAAAQGVDPESVTGAEAWAGRMGNRFEKAMSDREALSERLEDLASRLSFVLVPISMAILWLLLLFKRGYSLYDHAVVALYGIGFLAVLVALTFPLQGDAGGWARGLVAIAAPVHAVVHLKGAYALSWFGAVLRGIFLGLLSAIAFLAFLITVVMIGVMA